MFKKVKEHLKQVIEISNSCPETYRNKCFEVLLESLVRVEHEKVNPYMVPGEGKRGNTQPFLVRNEISGEQLDKVFDFDGNKYEIIVNNLNDATNSKKQVKLALLLGAKSLLEADESFFTKDSLIEICKKYSCFDQANFSAYMKKNKLWFLSKDSGWTLTKPGQQEAVKVIKELAQ